VDAGTSEIAAGVSGVPEVDARALLKAIGGGQQQALLIGDWRDGEAVQGLAAILPIVGMQEEQQWSRAGGIVVRRRTRVIRAGPAAGQATRRVFGAGS